MHRVNPNYVRVPDMRGADPDELFVCPYDPVHRVAAKRFPYHLMKCRKNWAGKVMSTCPFNARHIVPQPEFRHHVANCADKACIEQDLAYAQRQEGQDGSYSKGCTDVPAYNRKIPSPTEDWDREVANEVAVGYDVDEHLPPGVFRNLTGYTPAEKREFHRRTGKFHFKSQEDVDTHVQGSTIHRPTAVRPNGYGEGATQAQQRSTASSYSSTTPHMRLPKQLPKAAEVAAVASMPNGRDNSVSKRGGRAIAANIFGAGRGTSDTMTANHQQMSTPMANSEMQNGYSGATLTNGAGLRHSSSSFQKPIVGVGRGLVPGLGRGVVPGIGRGLVTYNAFKQEPKVGLQQQC